MMGDYIPITRDEVARTRALESLINTAVIRALFYISNNKEMTNYGTIEI